MDFQDFLEILVNELIKFEVTDEDLLRIFQIKTNMKCYRYRPWTKIKNKNTVIVVAHQNGLRGPSSLSPPSQDPFVYRIHLRPSTTASRLIFLIYTVGEL